MTHNLDCELLLAGFYKRNGPSNVICKRSFFKKKKIR